MHDRTGDGGSGWGREVGHIAKMQDQSGTHREIAEETDRTTGKRHLTKRNHTKREWGHLARKILAPIAKDVKVQIRIGPIAIHALNIEVAAKVACICAAERQPNPPPS